VGHRAADIGARETGKQHSAGAWGTKNPPGGGFLFFWLGDQDYSPLRGSPLRGRLAGSPFNLACARFVEPEVLILAPQKQKPA